MIEESIIRQVKEVANAHKLELISDYVSLTKKGREYVGPCPLCGKNHFSFVPGKGDGIYKCFSCDFGGNDAIKFVERVSNINFYDSIRSVANRFGIDLREEKPVQPKPAKESKLSFCERMLKESGLTYKDVTATVQLGDGATKPTARTFRPGTINDKGEIVEGDDVIIEYYDLEGKPVTYEKKDHLRRGTGRYAAFFRVRWQYPEAHKDKDGDSFKYKSPYGAGTPVYIPQAIRTAYRRGDEVPRLFIQEGEKKAEKACKHGILSFGIGGIQNLGYNGTLPQDIVEFIKKCHVREVIFLMDSDWNDLSKNLRIGVAVEKRPNNFFHAALNFKDYMKKLGNYNIFVDTYVGHTINHNGDKGIDDLLTNTLKGREDELKQDIEHLMNEKVMTGQYVHLDKVTTMSDALIQRIWGLDRVDSFVKMHLRELSLLPEFLFKGRRYRIEDEKIVSVEPIDDDEKFWLEETRCDRSGNERTVVSFAYTNSGKFLGRRGYALYRRDGDSPFSFIHIADHFVRYIKDEDAGVEIRRFVKEFAEDFCSLQVQDMLIKGNVAYLGPHTLKMSLPKVTPSFLPPSRDCQYFYFKDVFWCVSRNGIDELRYNAMTHDVWADRRRDLHVRKLPPLITFDKSEDGSYTYSISAEGKLCHFLQFLINASNFTWRKAENGQVDNGEEKENAQHLLSKLCAIGYMAMDVKDAGVTRAVIAMDGRQGEVGESNGRSGKSLVGELMRHITSVVYIGGKRDHLLDDQFLWDAITERTRLVYIDDVKQNFDFEPLFPLITGDWTVNHKGAERVTLPFSISPKIYIPTNHAISGNGPSFLDRQWLILFSDFYNENHKPIDDFRLQFFYEWDDDQWNLTWNLVATCIQLYLNHGVVQAPGDRAEQRRLRQEITEGFLQWFSEYFSDPGRFGVLLPRSELQEQCRKKTEMNTSPTIFKRRFRKACEFYGWVFNPNMYDPATGKPFQFDRDGRPVTDYKKGGVEYFMVGTPDGQPPVFDYTPPITPSTQDADDGPF